MKKLDKTNLITICVAGGLLLVLVIVLIVGGCARREGTQWSPLKPKETTEEVGTTGADEKDGTKDTDPSGTGSSDPSGSTGNTNPSGGNDNTPTTKPTTGNGSTPTSQPTSGPTTQPTSGPTTQPTSGPTTQPTSGPTTQPTEPTGGNTEPTGGQPQLLTWEEYLAMTSAEQIAYMNSFPSVEDYLVWFKAAKEAYNNAHTGVIGPDGSIDLGNLGTQD